MKKQGYPLQDKDVKEAVQYLEVTVQGEEVLF